MIGVIIILTVCITIGGIASIRMNREMNRIKELEDRLDEYYKQREQRLTEHKKDQTITKEQQKMVDSLQATSKENITVQKISNGTQS